jgi:8-oxo-dGTP pyrophosphatase MutT (NUDIX family)
MDFDPRKLPSPYYRVATRAIILDDQQRLLVMENKDNEVELPGGGWEFDETYQECLQREVREELGVELAEVGEFVGAYQGRGSRQVMYLRIAFRAKLASHDFRLSEMVRAWFVTRDEFMELDFNGAGEESVKQLTDIIWDKE